MEIDSSELARITCFREDTPDGPLTTFEWIGDSNITSVATGFMDEHAFGFRAIIPWTVEVIGENRDSGMTYLKRTDM